MDFRLDPVWLLPGFTEFHQLPACSDVGSGRILPPEWTTYPNL
ncbi:unnamed protein product, partial [Didymodactylos carnosus]